MDARRWDALQTVAVAPPAPDECGAASGPEASASPTPPHASTHGTAHGTAQGQPQVAGIIHAAPPQIAGAAARAAAPPAGPTYIRAGPEPRLMGVVARGGFSPPFAPVRGAHVPPLFGAARAASPPFGGHPTLGAVSSRVSAGGGHVSGIGFTPSGRRLFLGAEGFCMGLEIDTLGRRVFGDTGDVC